MDPNQSESSELDSASMLVVPDAAVAGQWADIDARANRIAEFCEQNFSDEGESFNATLNALFFLAIANFKMTGASMADVHAGVDRAWQVAALEVSAVDQA